MRALVALSLLGLVATLAPSARADIWCATPVWAHEWGVHVYAGDGTPLATAEGLPDWFHGAADPSPDVPVPVRSLPADGGMRRLPVVHFYAADPRPIPLGVEVGFTTGPATAWFPAVDVLRTALEANGDAAAAGHAALVEARNTRLRTHDTRAALPADPTRQLVWERLELTTTATSPPRATDQAWVDRARALPARWVSRGAESERFLFYEAATAEPLPLRLRQAPGYAPGHRAYVLENRGGRPLHDLVLTHAELGATYVFAVSELPGGASAPFVLEDLRVADRRAATWERLRAALVDPAFPAPPETYVPNGPCVMERDPAIPFERVDGHRLFAAEVDLLLSYWGARFFDQPGTTVVWREDAATLNANMPLSLFTDMYHYVLLRRAGLALWERVQLP